MRFYRLFALLICLATVDNAQVGLIGSIEQSEEKVGTPKAKPEPRRPIAADPIALVTALQSAGPAERYRAEKLIWPGMTLTESEAPTFSEIHLSLINLDDDDEPEAVIEIKMLPIRNRDALVLDRQKGSWWVVGEFEQRSRYVDVSRHVELRSTVSSRHVDFILRDTEGGTNVQDTTLWIYRLLNGHLYQVFKTVEDLRTWGIGEKTERRAIEYNVDEPASLVVRTIIEESAEWSASKRATVSHRCRVYRWSPATFQFEPAPSLFATSCSVEP